VVLVGRWRDVRGSWYVGASKQSCSVQPTCKFWPCQYWFLYPDVFCHFTFFCCLRLKLNCNGL
jgi:hypothetical protein